MELHTPHQKHHSLTLNAPKLEIVIARKYDGLTYFPLELDKSKRAVVKIMAVEAILIVSPTSSVQDRHRDQISQLVRAVIILQQRELQMTGVAIRSRVETIP